MFGRTSMPLEQQQMKAKGSSIICTVFHFHLTTSERDGKPFASTSNTRLRASITSSAGKVYYYLVAYFMQAAVKSIPITESRESNEEMTVQWGCNRFSTTTITTKLDWTMLGSSGDPCPSIQLAVPIWATFLKCQLLVIVLTNQSRSCCPNACSCWLPAQWWLLCWASLLQVP